MPHRTKRAKLPHRFVAHKIDKHRRLLAEIPRRLEEQQQNSHSRNQMLAATQAYNLGIERRRIKARIIEMLGMLQRQMAQSYIGDLDKRIHRLAATGRP